EERIICTGNEVWHYKIPGKQIFIYSLGKDQRQRALEEGPLPFLFNLKAAEAEKRYGMKLYRETKDSYYIAVYPRFDIDKESFSRAFVQLSRTQAVGKEYLLPIWIEMISPDGKSTKDFRFSQMKPNAAVEDSNFRGVVPTAKDSQGRQIWTVHRPDDNAPPPQVGAAAPAGPASRQPARPKRRFGRPQ